jgi:hypothetical protein
MEIHVVKKTYLVFITIGTNETLTSARIAESAGMAKQTISKISDGEHKLAFASSDGAGYAFFLRCEKDARFIRAALDGAGEFQPTLRNNDSCLVVELGPDYSGQGFSQAWTWLQHHHKP